MYSYQVGQKWLRETFVVLLNRQQIGVCVHVVVEELVVVVVSSRRKVRGDDVSSMQISFGLSCDRSAGSVVGLGRCDGLLLRFVDHELVEKS